MTHYICVERRENFQQFGVSVSIIHPIHSPAVKSEPMSEIVIRCPKCSKGLKLKDRSRIGKKAKCPKCESVFVMQQDQVASATQAKTAAQAKKSGQATKKKRKAAVTAAQTETPSPAVADDDEVEFQLAQPTQPAAASQQAPVQVAAGKWVPDDAPPTPQQQPAMQPGGVQAPGVFDPTAPAPPQQQGVGVAPVESGVARMADIRRRNKKRTIISCIVGLITAGAFFGAYSWADQRKKDNAKAKAEAKDKRPKQDKELVAKKDALKANSNLAAASSPTSGEKINFACLPLGARAIISIRPAELLEEGSKRLEFWYCLGPTGEWITGGEDENGEFVPGKLETLCHRKPADIEHALIAVIPGEVGEPAQYAAVITLKEPAKKSELLRQYGGDRTDDYGYPVYINDEQAFLIKDLKTIAIAPAALAEEMATSIDIPNSQSDGMEALVQHTDANRHCTVMFNPRSMLRFEDVLFAEDVRPLIRHVMGFFNDDEIETVSWAVHLGDQKFHSEIFMRNRNEIREHQLQSEISKKLAGLPDRVWHELVERMNPTQLGPRRVISRFPAMVKLFSHSTIGGIGTRYAQIVTEMPERAAPNLALATLLAWDESTRTDFTKSINTSPTTSGPKLPALVADRLKMKFEFEFNRMPLQDAMRLIAEECKINQSINGDALKDKGYTKNMPQSFKMNDSGFAVLKKIIAQYADMCIVLNESDKSILLTTRKFAAQDGLQVYEIK